MNFKKSSKTNQYIDRHQERVVIGQILLLSILPQIKFENAPVSMKEDHRAKVPSSQGWDEDTTGSDEMSAGRTQEKKYHKWEQTAW